MSGFLRLGIKNRRQNLIKLIGGYSSNRGFPVDQSFLYHFRGNPNGGKSGTLTITGLQHVKFLIFDGKLKVLHILEMLFEFFLNQHEFFKWLGQDPLKLGDWLRSPNPCNNIFALGIRKKFTVKNFFATCGITSEAHTGSGLLTGVSKYHRLDINGSAPFCGNTVLTPVNSCPIIHP